MTSDLDSHLRTVDERLDRIERLLFGLNEPTTHAVERLSTHGAARDHAEQLAQTIQQARDIETVCHAGGTVEVTDGIITKIDIPSHISPPIDATKRLLKEFFGSPDAAETPASPAFRETC